MISADWIDTQYDIEPVHSITRLSEGLIHQSFIVNCEGTRFVIQGLHPNLSDEGILEDYAAVTEYLDTQGYGSPLLIRGRDGTLAPEDPDGCRWRLSTYVPGETITRIDTVERANISGKALGLFHTHISGLQHTFRSKHPGHDTVGHWNRLQAVLQNPDYRGQLSLISARANQILEALSELFLPEGLPKVIVHGDPKVTNLRYQKDHAVLIDLDTCAVHTRLVDLGDAVRSWCHQPDAPLGSRFSIPKWKALFEGYLSVSGPLSVQEIDLLPSCGRLITLELASRFARDVLEDYYFAFDQTRYESRRAQNLQRVEQMWSLAEEQRQAEPILKDFITKYIG